MSSPKLKKRKHSPVWDYCTPAPNHFIICNICKKMMKNINTTNIRKHLQNVHNIILESASKPKTEIVNHSTRSEENSIDEPKFDKNLIIKADKITDYKIADFDENVSIPNSINKRSIVWNYFKKSTNGQYVRCTLCSNILRFSGNTSNLRHHLSRKHGDDFLYMPSTENEETVSTVFTEENQLDHSLPDENIIIETEPPPTRHKLVPKLKPYPPKINFRFLEEDAKLKLDRLSIEMLVFDYHQLSFIESNAFIRLIKQLEPLYTPPGCELVTSSLLPSWQSEIEAKVRSIIDSVGCLSVSVELFRSERGFQQTFLVLTAHYIADERLQSQVLEAKEVFDDYTSDTLAEIILTICTNWRIDSKIVAFVTNEEEASVGEALDYLPPIRQPCIGALLNAMLNKALEAVGGLIELVQTINYQLRKNFVQSSLWHMCLIAMEHVQQYGQVSEYLVEADYGALSECFSLLKPFRSFSTELLRDKFPTASSIIPLVRGIVITLQKQSPDTTMAQELQEQLLESLEKFIAFETNKLFASATFLDPRFKKSAFSNKSNAKLAEEFIIEELIEIVASVNEQTNAETKIEMHQTNEKGDDDLLSVWSDFDNVKDVASDEATKITVALILRQYLELPNLNRTQNPSEFWIKYKFILPELYQLYLKYFSIPVVATPTNFVLLRGDVAIRDRRQEIDLDYLNMFEFINSFYANAKQ